MAMTVTWYFAYGRNMNVFRLRERISENPFLTCRGILPGYRMVFNKSPGPENGLGYANVMPEAGGYVEGVLYLLSERSLSCLDRCEKGYVRRLMTVWNIDHQR